MFIAQQALIAEQAKTVDACRFCFMCRHVCTMGVTTGREADTPRGKGLILSKILNGTATWTPDLVDSMHRCSLCAVCRTWCLGGYTMPETVLLARRDIVNQGLEPEGARRIRAHVLGTGNPFGRPASERFRSIETGGLFREGAEVLYYAGCDTAYRSPEIANAFIGVLRRAGVDFAMLQDEFSTGKPLTVLGYHEKAQGLGRKLAARIAATGCRTLVTACPSSYDAFRNDIELPGIEVLHASSYLARLLGAGKLAPRPVAPRSLTIQDSEMLCRHNDDDGAGARTVLAAIPGVELREMHWRGKLAYSCGEAGGVFDQMHPDLAMQVGRRALDEAVRTGASTVVSLCPVGKRTLTGANTNGIAILDLVEIVAEAVA